MASANFAYLPDYAKWGTGSVAFPIPAVPGENSQCQKTELSVINLFHIQKTYSGSELLYETCRDIKLPVMNFFLIHQLSVPVN